MTRHVLTGLLAVATICAACSSGAAAEMVKPRFTLDSSGAGFVRLDTATGAVTHCSVTNGTWTCDPILAPDEGLGPRVDALAGDVARLTAEMAALRTQVDQLADRAAAPPAGGAPAVAAAEHAPARTLAKRIVSRFLAMVHQLKHGRREAATPS
jgi:hypothetical protein